MNKRITLLIGFLLMGGGVALGAFGAHAWKVRLAATGRADTFDLGIRYLMIHALALLLMGSLMDHYPRLHIGAKLLMAGILFFSGSLITLALSNIGMWGAVAPLGGACLILGWLAGAWAVWRP